MSRTVQARDLLELLAWIDEAEKQHPGAKIEHVERVEFDPTAAPTAAKAMGRE